MSNALAIAAVTETLVNLISSHLDASGVTGAQVLAISPDGSLALPNPGVNIFLYQVTPNTAYRNADLPTRAADGTLLKKPQVALDLHYLFTFYGDDRACEQQRMLAAVALALHANPTLPRSLITSVQGTTSFLAGSTLDTQAELIRFTPIVFTLEELSKLWSFLLKVDYVLSTAYLASVVLIETDDQIPAPALPVTSFTATAQAVLQPVITQITASPNAAAPIIDGGTIALIGTNLAASAGSATQVLITGSVLTPLSVSATSVTVTLPAGNFAAGALTAQISQPLLLGQPPVLHPGTGVTSGIAAFVLLPSIVAGSISVAAGPAITLTVTPTVQPSQRAVLQLTSKSTSVVSLFDGGTLTTASSSLTIPTPGLASGTYFVQVLIDGALSPLTPTSGPPTGPLVTV